jgi:ubiquinone/menaquinone biosynthesis C-methylase UbiE
MKKHVDFSEEKLNLGRDKTKTNDFKSLSYKGSQSSYFAVETNLE